MTLSESDAAEFAGVTVATLNRYVKAGYLTVTVKDGVNYYSKKDLMKSFSVGGKGAARPPQPVEPARLPTAAIGDGTDALEKVAQSKPRRKRTAMLQTGSKVVKPSPDVLEMKVKELEKMIVDKETTIEDLRTQRNWLQERIEKLEISDRPLQTFEQHQQHAPGQASPRGLGAILKYFGFKD